VQQFPLTLGYATGLTVPIAATTAGALKSGAPDNVFGLYVLKAIVKGQTNTTLDVTNNWSIELWKQTSAAVSLQLGSSANTFAVGRTAGTPYLNVITVNTAYALTDIYNFFVTITKNAAPGTFGFDPGVLWYRLIGV
jgi:hypothetical protein